MSMLDDVLGKQGKQGAQDYPDGTSTRSWFADATVARGLADEHARAGTCTWLDLLRREVFEAFAEESPQLLRAELIQVAAVAVQWIQAVDRREI